MTHAFCRPLFGCPPGKAPERCPSHGRLPGGSAPAVAPFWHRPGALPRAGPLGGNLPPRFSLGLRRARPRQRLRWFLCHQGLKRNGLGPGAQGWGLESSRGNWGKVWGQRLTQERLVVGKSVRGRRAVSRLSAICRSWRPLQQRPLSPRPPTLQSGQSAGRPPPSWRRLGVLGKITPAFPFPEGPEHLKREGTRRHLESSHGGGAPSFRTAGVHDSDAGDASSAWLSGAHPRQSQRRGAVCPPPLGQPASHASHEPPGRWTKTTSKCLSGLHSGQNRTASTWFPLWASVCRSAFLTGQAKLTREVTGAQARDAELGAPQRPPPRLFTPRHRNQT